MASGSGAQIAITRADSLHQLVTDTSSQAWRWTNFVSESLEHKLEELEEGSITGYKDAPPSHKGTDFGEGDIEFEPNPDAIGSFMRGAFGLSSGTLVCHAGSTGANSNAYGAGRPVFQHRFTPIQTAFSDQSFLPPYHLMSYKDTGSAFFFQGAVIPNVEFTIEAGQLAKSKATIMSRGVTRLARTSSLSALSVPKSRPWVWDMASIQVGLSAASLAANTNFESITLALDTPLEGVVLLDGNKQYAEFQVNEFRRVQISGTISFRNQEEYDAFVAYENRYLRVTLRNSNSAMILGNPSSAFYPTLQFDVPQMKFLTYQVPVQGPNRLQSQFTARAEFDTTSLYQIEAVLTNVTSLY